MLDDFSRYIVAWKLCTNMRAEDVTATLIVEPSGLDQAELAQIDRACSLQQRSRLCHELTQRTCFFFFFFFFWKYFLFLCVLFLFYLFEIGHSQFREREREILMCVCLAQLRIVYHPRQQRQADAAAELIGTFKLDGDRSGPSRCKTLRVAQLEIKKILDELKEKTAEAERVGGYPTFGEKTLGRGQERI